MFFIVYFIVPRIHKVVPHKWIIGISKHLEKFLNHGLNRNQKFAALWTDDPAAFDENDMPKVDYLPTNLTVTEDVFPNEGFYECHLVGFKGNYDEALAYSLSRRNRRPAIYNPDRLHELPLPRLQTARQTVFAPDRNSVLDDLYQTNPENNAPSNAQNQEEFANENSDSILQISPVLIHTQESSSDQENEVQYELASEDPLRVASSTPSSLIGESVDPLDQRDEHPIAEEEDRKPTSVPTRRISHSFAYSSYVSNVVYDDNPDASLDDDAQKSDETASQKQVMVSSSSAADQVSTADTSIPSTSGVNNSTFAASNQAQNASAHVLLEEPATRPEMICIDLDNDETDETMSFSQFPMPIIESIDGRMQKRENDFVSGCRSFFETGTGRVYQIGFDLVEIPISVIEKLQDWNASPQNDNLDIDRCFTLAVLLTLVEKEDIINGNVSDAVREFIRDLMMVRTNADGNRVANAQIYIENYCASAKEEASKSTEEHGSEQQ